MQRIKFAHIGFVLCIISLAAVFYTTVPSMQVSAATVIRSPSAHITTYTATPGNKFKVEIVMGNAIKKLKITSKSKKLKVIKYNIAKKTKAITITLQLDETATAGVYKAVISNNGKTKIINVKVKKNSVQSNVNATVPSSASIGGSSLSLGSSLSEVQLLLKKTGMILIDQGKGVNDYDTDCYYYFNNDFDEKGDPIYSTGCMVEFYNGSLDRIIFGSKNWSFGKLSNSTKLKNITTSSNSIGNVSGSENYKYKFHTEFYNNSTFTMYYDNKEEWKSPGWCLCEWKSNIKHSGSNSLKDKTIKMKRDLSTYDLDDDIKLKKTTIVKNCKNMDALAVESGKQAVYFQNFYRVYHGVYPATYSFDLTELAYVNAYVRSKLNVHTHLQPFYGDLMRRIIMDVSDNIRVNEWWIGCAQNLGENVGYGINSPLHETLTTIASTPHLETMFYSGGFAAGSVILNGYSNFEGVTNYKMSADEITQAQRDFIINTTYDVMYDTLRKSEPDAWYDFCDNRPDYGEYYSKYDINDDLPDEIYTKRKEKAKKEYKEAEYEYYKPYLYYGLNFYGFTDISEVSAVLEGERFSSDYYYELTYLSKENWVDFLLEKYELKDVPGFKKYLEIQYDSYYGSACTDVYNGYDGFGSHFPKSKKKQAYLYFCEQVYDTDFTNALASHFNCNTEDVYTKHSDVLVELVDATTATFQEFVIKKGYISNIIYEDENYDDDDEIDDEIRLSSGFLRVDYKCYYNGRRISSVELKQGYTYKDAKIDYIFDIADKYEIPHKVAAAVWISHFNRTANTDNGFIDMSYFDGYL